MNYKSFADLANDIKNWLKKLPHDYDLIVGVPRSGMLPANLIALYMNLPMTDIKGLLNKRIISSGHRLIVNENNLFNKDNLKILVVDDSVSSGKQMKAVKKDLELLDSKFDISYIALYASNRGKKNVDNYYQILKQPRCFEWNIFHHGPLLKKSCVDIDGILCRDPTDGENDDGRKYKQFINKVKPYILPTKKIGWLVTCRLEKYRELTETWLKKHNVDFDNLIMMDLPDKKTRQRLDNYAEYKAKIYNETKAKLFFESSMKQAIKITTLSGKDVFCLETNKIYNPVIVRNMFVKSKELSNKFKDNPLKSVKKSQKAIKKLFGL